MTKAQLKATQTATGWTTSTGQTIAPNSAAPNQVIAQLHATATQANLTFPLPITIEPTNAQPIHLLLHQNMTTELAPTSEPTTTPKKPATKKVLYTTATLTLLTLLAATTYLTHQNTTKEATTETTPVIHTIDQNQTILTLNNNNILYATNGTTLTATDLTTGTTTTYQETTNPTKTRTLTTGTTTAIDSGEGTVLLLEGTKEPQHITGTLNARGTAPVILTETTYTTTNQPATPIPPGTSILAATEQNTLLVKAPATLHYSNDGRTIDLQGPSPGARVAAWIAGNESRALSVWQEEEKYWLILSDTTQGGATLLTHPVTDAKQVKVSKGNITIGDSQALIDDQIKDICPNGKWLNQERWCPTPEGKWTNQQQTVDQEPQAITEKYIIINNEVKER